MVRISLTVNGDTLKDMDKLIQAKFYRNRTELVDQALMKIEPLKRLREERTAETMMEIIKLSKKGKNYEP